MSDLDAQLERLQDYYETDEVIDEDGGGGGGVVKAMRLNLPYNNPDWTGTDVLHCILRIHHGSSVSIEVVAVSLFF